MMAGPEIIAVISPFLVSYNEATCLDPKQESLEIGANIYAWNQLNLFAQRIEQYKNIPVSLICFGPIGARVLNLLGQLPEHEKIKTIMLFALEKYPHPLTCPAGVENFLHLSWNESNWNWAKNLLTSNLNRHPFTPSAPLAFVRPAFPRD